jgi:anti-sigma factor ChrR (cupin superfamily)
MLNLDFNQRIVVDTDAMAWTGSPSSGVLRKPLERAGEESGRATSIVRYEPGARFATHIHPGGEEIMVLEGVFSDEQGDYGPGTYLRNPPGSSHAPFSKEGCTLFVKLHQFDPQDQASVRINMYDAAWQSGIGPLNVLPLHTFRRENVALVKWPAGATFPRHRHVRGEEILVLSGVFRDENSAYPKHYWLRSPHLSEHQPYVEESTLLWVKTGHLPVTE